MRFQLSRHKRQATGDEVRSARIPHTKEWNGGLAGEHVRRENAIHTQTRGVRVCVSQSKRENHPVPQEGGWEIEWPYIHKDMVCVCVYGKRENTILFHRGVAGSPSSLACTHSWKTTKPQGGRGISCSTGGGGGAMRIHHDVHYLLKYKST